ncbi:hypothetical protein GCM10011507_09290 [Edaphobacter acidisoli]|uniref:Galactose oxidase-like Early set domain-containing protein n=1 Tax=Edaphobacter acidisoli TaxID=2040573 RepID=A0A916W1Z4_9BACT|nr:hypothetical protein GCM10011507_09290 [Edaphobacter acidisoli]
MWLVYMMLALLAAASAHGAIATDVTVSQDHATASTTITSPAFSTGTGNELLLAFVSTDYLSGKNTTVTGISGGGLTWVLVRRTNGQSGTSEIWRAFATSSLSNATVTATLSQSVMASMTVMSFAGVNTSGTNGSGAIGATAGASASRGAPTASLVTTVGGSWVIGVGNDFDNAIGRTVGSGQELIHQYLSPAGDTYWVQMRTTPVDTAGTKATINDTAPTGDRYNLSICEILPAATGATTWDLSGAITPVAGGSGATVTLSGAANATTVADANGNYSFASLANGSYTVTPSATGYTFTPASQAVTINGANQTSVNFTAQAVVVSGIQLIQSNANGNEATAASISTTFTANNVAGDFLLVQGTIARPAGSLAVSDTLGNTYIPVATPATDPNQGVTSYMWYVPLCKGGANTVTLTPAVAGALEIHVSEWTGLSATYPVDVSTSAAGTSANVSSGAVTTTTAGELIYGYGFVFNTATAGSGFTPMTLVNGDLDEYEIQASTGSIAATFTQVSGTWFATVATFRPSSATVRTIAGSVSPSASGGGVTVALTGTVSATVTTDANGNYSFAGLPNGTYTVTPSLSGSIFSPVSQAVTVNGADQTGVNFTVQTTGSTWSVSGSITPATGGGGTTVTLTGVSSGSVTSDAGGNYSFSGLANGSYTITPSKTGYTFNPVSQNVTVNGANQTSVNFTALGNGPTWSISGTISPSSGGSGATLALSGPSSASTVADAGGNYSFSGLANGLYTVAPAKNGYTFDPASQAVSIGGANATGINFTAVAPSNSISLDVDKSQDESSPITTVTSPAFSTAASNELLLAFVSTDYLKGANTTVTGVTGGGLTWELVERTNGQSGDAEVWRAFATSTVSNATVTATLSQGVVSSITVMSFSGVDTSGTNGSGAIGAVAGNSASSGAPTASLVTTGNNSWVLGVGNDFDNAIARTVGSGQSLVHQYLTPTGDTYWVQMLSNPVAAGGTTATINDTAPTKDRFNLSIVEVLAGGGGTNTTPPTVSMTSPASGALVSGPVTVSAMASDPIAVSGVQFLLDGSPLGTQVTTPPYSMTWDSTTVADGPHTLAAIATDNSGLSTTSSSVPITVNNSANAAIVGSWSSPIATPAVAVNLILLQNNRVLFYPNGSDATVWDYVANTFTNVPVSVDLFCSGAAMMSDGRVFVAGGYGESSTTIGIKSAEIFDPSSLTWTTLPNMQYRRWYPNVTALPDGRMLVVAGWQTSANTNAGISEIYDPSSNAWTSLTNANNPFETYPFLYVMPDGRVIHIGGSEYATDTDILDLTTTSWSVIDSNIVDGSSATMYLPGKFMKAGSAADSQNVGPSSNTTFVLDTTQPSPAWRQTASMAYPRSFMNLTMLPDGTTLATGGETDKNGGNIANAVYAAELWSPSTQTWSTMASMHTPREYHGTALLLPDGRVLESGMGDDFGNVPDEDSAEFYSPPYLFKGARPTITQAPSQIQLGTTFFVATPDAASIASVALIRTGAVTHFFDQNERYLPLSFTQTSGGLTVTAPVNTNLAPPGYYMLFIVNNSGVPSIAPFVQVP